MHRGIFVAKFKSDSSLFMSLFSYQTLHHALCMGMLGFSGKSPCITGKDMQLRDQKILFKWLAIFQNRSVFRLIGKRQVAMYWFYPGKKIFWTISIFPSAQCSDLLVFKTFCYALAFFFQF